jgi:uncharacterized membrane protein YsdA (DUF1294 family)
MTAPEAIMLAFVFTAGTLIVWLLAIEGFEAARKKRRTPEERRLDEVAESAIRRARETAQERFGRFGQ